MEITPAAFKPEAIAAETHAHNEQVEAAFRAWPPPYDRDPVEIRETRESGKGISGPLQLVEQARNRTIPGRDGEIPVRLFIPQTVEGVYVALHGGGWVFGRAHHADFRNWEIACNCRLAVVSVDYRLAPEHPYPAGPDDCEDVALWLAAHAQQELGSARLLIGGDSAGAQLSVVTLTRLRDRHGFRGFQGANLEHGFYDLTLTPSAANWGKRELMLSTPTLRWFVDFFVPEGRRRDPDVSPMYAQLEGLPPALFTAGTLDPLLDDSLFMSTRWTAAGNEAELAVYPGGSHEFNAAPIAIGREANARIDRFLRETGAP